VAKARLDEIRGHPSRSRRGHPAPARGAAILAAKWHPADRRGLPCPRPAAAGQLPDRGPSAADPAWQHRRAQRDRPRPLKSAAASCRGFRRSLRSQLRGAAIVAANGILPPVAGRPGRPRGTAATAAGRRPDPAGAGPAPPTGRGADLTSALTSRTLPRAPPPTPTTPNPRSPRARSRTRPARPQGHALRRFCKLRRVPAGRYVSSRIRRPS